MQNEVSYLEVRCPRCDATHQVDRNALIKGDQRVVCASCSTAYRVRVKTSSTHPLAPPLLLKTAPTRETADWYLRQRDGAVFKFSTLSELKAWVARGVVHIEDQVSRGGTKWRRLRDVPEFAGLFLRVSQGKSPVLELEVAQIEEERRAPSRLSPLPGPPPLPPPMPPVPLHGDALVELAARQNSRVTRIVPPPVPPMDQEPVDEPLLAQVPHINPHSVVSTISAPAETLADVEDVPAATEVPDPAPPAESFPRAAPSAAVGQTFPEPLFVAESDSALNRAFRPESDAIDPFSGEGKHRQERTRRFPVSLVMVLLLVLGLAAGWWLRDRASLPPSQLPNSPSVAASSGDVDTVSPGVTETSKPRPTASGDAVPLIPDVVVPPVTVTVLDKDGPDDSPGIPSATGGIASASSDDLDAAAGGVLGGSNNTIAQGPERNPELKSNTPDAAGGPLVAENAKPSEDSASGAQLLAKNSANNSEKLASPTQGAKSAKASEDDESSYSYDALMKKGNSALSSQPQAALGFFQKASRKSASVEPLAKIGYAYLNLGRVQDAIAAFDVALRRNERYAASHIGMARALTRAGRRAEARTHYERYLEINPTGSQAEEARRGLQ